MLLQPNTQADADLTVIIPCFNPQLRFFQSTLQCVQLSTFRNFEIIVVDDASNEPAHLELLEETRLCEPCLRVVRHPRNLGLSAARNTGVAHCTTPYFLQLDADDLIEPTFIEKCLWALESHPEWSFCNAWHIGFGGRDYKWPYGFDKGVAYLQENQTVPIAVIRRDANRAIGGHDETIRDGLEDWDYWLKMAAHGYWGGTIPEYLIRYRIHSPPTFWPNRDDPVRFARFRTEMRRRYPQLWKRGGWPQLKPNESQHRVSKALMLDSANKLSDTNFLFVLPRLALGGEERFLLTLLEQLKQRDRAVSVCATAAGPHLWQAVFAQHTPDVFILPNFLRPEDYARFLVEHIRARRITAVLIASSLLGYSLLPYLRAHCPGVVFVDYVHMVDETWRAGGYARVSLNAHVWLDLTMTSSAHARDWLVAQGAEAARVAICPTSIDARRWDPARYDRPALRRALKVPDARPIILCAARLDVQKRPALLIDVLARLRQRGLAFTCLIAGDGPQRARLQRAIALQRLGDSVRWLGAVEPGRIPELMAASDIFCLPSANEGIALSLYEAMAMALPVVAADVGGQRELVTPETGMLISRRPDETDAYADALTALLNSPHLRQTLGQAARQRVVEHFPVERLTDQMLELFTQARALAQQTPRSAPSLEEAEAIARQVAELFRQGALFDHLFEGPPEAIERLRPVHRLLRWLKMRWLRPLYFWGLERGLDWLAPLKLAWRRVWRLRR